MILGVSKRNAIDSRFLTGGLYEMCGTHLSSILWAEYKVMLELSEDASVMVKVVSC